MYRHLWSFASLVAFCVLCSGCNTSRYGQNYNQWLATVKTVAVIPLDIRADSLHTGGAKEPRPDLAADASRRLVREVGNIIASRGRRVVAAEAPSSQPSSAECALQSKPLAIAIGQAIVTHHYVYGKSPTFDYSLGDTVQELRETPSDAVLYVSLESFVPTAGRQALKATAIVVGGLLGVQRYIDTSQAGVAMILVDSHTGEILWYNYAVQKVDVRSERALRNLVKETSTCLLKPRDS